MTYALDLAERVADGRAPIGWLASARARLRDAHPQRLARWDPLYIANVRSVPAWHAARDELRQAVRGCAVCAAWSAPRHRTASGELGGRDLGSELAAHTALIRDIFGNPFRPPPDAAGWRTSTAVALAEQAYESRDFAALPVLADALQDAGCDDEHVLRHLRGPGPHARGCWAVDLVLGRG